MNTGREPATRIGWLVKNEPQKARAEILEALERSRGRLVRAAVELGVSRRHLLRYNWELNLWPQVDAIRDGFRANVGRVMHNGGEQHGVQTH